MPDLQLDDISLHYEVSGDGPPLLMIAGMMSDSASWAPLLPLLEPHFTLIRPDNRTTGRTLPYDAATSLLHYVSDAIALLDHLGHDGVHILGHSMGGIVGMQIAASHPTRVASLTTAAVAPIRLTRNIHLFRALVAIRRSDAAPDTWLRTLFPWLFSPALYDVPDAIEQAIQGALAYPFAQSADAMAHQIDALAKFDVSELQNALSIPTQAILGGSDLLIPLADAQAALKGRLQHVIGHAGHSIHWDAPQDVATYVIDFVKANPITGAL